MGNEITGDKRPEYDEDDYLMEYAEKFGECFPTEMGVYESNLEEIVRKCIEEGKPFRVEIKPGVKY